MAEYGYYHWSTGELVGPFPSREDAVNDFHAQAPVSYVGGRLFEYGPLEELGVVDMDTIDIFERGESTLRRDEMLRLSEEDDLEPLTGNLVLRAVIEFILYVIFGIYAMIRLVPTVFVALVIGALVLFALYTVVIINTVP